MLDSYRRILRLPGALAFTAAGLLARLPMSMLGLGIVLLVSAQSGSYARAGAISAAALVACAVGAPVQGRLVDRLGQHVVLPATAAVFGLGIGLGLVAIHEGAPDPLPHLCAAVAGFALPQAGSMVRARWTYVAPPSSITTAFALEAVLDEVVFIVGPVLVTFLATAINPYAGLVVAAVASVTGSVALAAQRRTEPRASRRDSGAAVREKLAFGVVAPVVVASLGFGVLFGAAEVVTVAVADEAGHKAASGALLAVWAAGSLVAGFLVGALPSRVPPVVQLRWITAMLTLSVVPLLLAPNLWVLAGALLLSGLAIAPSMVATTRIIEQGVPRSRLTEAIGWFSTGLASGVAPGAAVSGWVVDTWGGSSGYLVCLGAGAAAFAGSWVIRRPRRPERVTVAEPEPAQ
ncbi:putative MFS family arabinose efflux permease [Mumia flava]|uniref:Putative MFS family arabinose efflux permease n=1 Tax=Mumia flava TaxID=1348852 RepID=A0A2M9B6S7_9ACTN|nr:MFS transporter [Mumia flava]PJJ53661.1 putative MFS family arabinose efflux permease [Mumia flava]